MILKGEYDTIDPEGLARSDNYYGWAKIAYENLGFMFATGQMNNGAKLQVSFAFKNEDSSTENEGFVLKMMILCGCRTFRFGTPLQHLICKIHHF